MHLVIVESPTKAKTIGKFLGKDYQVESSFGHIRDLPKSKIGIDVENNFEPHYIIPLKAKKNVTALKKLAAKSDTVIIATDEDREGEAIAWHLVQALGLNAKRIPDSNPSADGQIPKTERIVFHEITENAIKDALKNPREIDINLVNAQQARRILDRLVGYMLSPFLWRKVTRGLSAGRVQSVTVRLIVEKEEEIRKFKAEEYWTIVASLLKIKNQNKEIKNIEANLYKIGNETIGKMSIKNQEQAEKIKNFLENSEFKILSVEKKEVKKNPPPPFITSTLQQEGAKKLHYSSKQTMMFAQHLYEKGLITYMRTDSLNLSKDSLVAARALIKEKFGEKYLPENSQVYKTKSRLAQEAHEAIRPTDPFKVPEIINFEDEKEKKLYDLIWRRFIASQMPQAVFSATRVEIIAQNSLNLIPHTLVANGNILRFDGFLKVWPQKFEEKEIPELAENEKLNCEEIKTEQHFTEPPARYNEASLIKALENYDIGRPSTYAPTISVIQTRNYVQKNEQRRFQPTEIGEVVNKVLTENFPLIVDIQFTAHMEEDLDEIAEGKQEWTKVIKEFYGPFAKNLTEKYETVSKKETAPEEKTDEVCEKCGKPMVIKTGRFGKFLACTGFPDCKNTKSLGIQIKGEKKSFGPCSKCGAGEVVMKRTKKGKFFYGCNRYPDCDYASWTKPEESEKKDS